MTNAFVWIVSLMFRCASNRYFVRDTIRSGKKLSRGDRDRWKSLITIKKIQKAAWIMEFD